MIYFSEKVFSTTYLSAVALNPKTQRETGTFEAFDLDFFSTADKIKT